MFINKDLLIKKYNITTKRLLVLKPLYLTNKHLSSFITHYFIIIISFIDTHSTALAFVDEDSFIKKHNITTKRLLVPKPLYLINRLLFGFITHYFIATMIINYHIEFMLFYVIMLSPFTLVIFGMP